MMMMMRWWWITGMHDVMLRGGSRMGHHDEFDEHPPLSTGPVTTGLGDLDTQPGGLDALPGGRPAPRDPQHAAYPAGAELPTDDKR